MSESKKRALEDASQEAVVHKRRKTVAAFFDQLRDVKHHDQNPCTTHDSLGHDCDTCFEYLHSGGFTDGHHPGDEHTIQGDPNSESLMLFGKMTVCVGVVLDANQVDALSNLEQNRKRATEHKEYVLSHLQDFQAVLHNHECFMSSSVWWSWLRDHLHKNLAASPETSKLKIFPLNATQLFVGIPFWTRYSDEGDQAIAMSFDRFSKERMKKLTDVVRLFLDDIGCTALFPTLTFQLGIHSMNGDFNG